MSIADEIKNRLMDESVFFKELENLDPATLKEILFPFGEVINCWGALLATLIGQLQDIEHRMVLIRNLNDEHGHGDPAKTHVATYAEFLAALSEKEGTDDRSFAAVEFFVNFLDATLNINIEAPQFACLVLGMIEYSYIDISKCFNEYLLKHGLQVVHYTDHEILDVGHSTDLFQVALSLMPEITDDRLTMTLEVGSWLIHGLFSDLLATYRDPSLTIDRANVVRFCTDTDSP